MSTCSHLTFLISLNDSRNNNFGILIGNDATQITVYVHNFVLNRTGLSFTRSGNYCKNDFEVNRDFLFFLEGKCIIFVFSINIHFSLSSIIRIIHLSY